MKKTILAAAVAAALSLSVPAIGHASDMARQIDDMAGVVSQIKFLPEKDAAFTVPVGAILSYYARVHPSAGRGYTVQFDEGAFVMDCNIEYDDPEAVAEGRLGADSGTGYVNLSATRPGTFTLSIIHFIGGKEKGPVYTYTVTVAGSK